jgi:ubiquinone/menaquinone biosynthesis C-methylase UbiE
MNKWDGEIFLERLKLNEQASVLEIGVGTGRLAIKVLRIGCNDFTGVDISNKTIDRAKYNLREFHNCALVVGDFVDINLGSSFDIIYSSLTFFHISKKEEVIRKVWNLLNKGGRFI